MYVTKLLMDATVLKVLVGAACANNSLIVSWSLRIVSWIVLIVTDEYRHSCQSISYFLLFLL